MSKPALLDGGDAPPRFGSMPMWDVLHSRSYHHLDRIALLSPAQPAGLYAGLTKHWTHEPKDSSGTIGSLVRIVTNSWYHVINHGLSWVTPPPPKTGDYLSWSFGELQRASLRLGHYLRAKGLRPGMTAVIMLPVCAEWGLLLSTCALNGYTIALLDHKLLETDKLDLLRDYINELSPSLVVVVTAAGAQKVAACTNENKAVGLCIERLTGPPTDRWVSMEDIEEYSLFPDCIRPDAAPYDPDSTAVVVYTSGTSGKPKGCVIQSSQLVQCLDAVRGVPMLPCTGTVISGSSAQSRCPSLLMSIWCSGNSAALNASVPTGETLLATMAATKPIFISLLVGQLSAIYPMRYERRNITSSVRMAVLVGSTITQASVKRAQLVFHKAAIKTAFGLTEANRIADWKTRPPKVQNFPTWNGIAASGKVCPGARAKIVDEHGECARRNEIGELHLGGIPVISGYVGGFQDSAFYKENGCNWYMSGDSGVMDDMGYIYVVGRTNSIFKRNGRTIVPASVENVLETLFPEAVIAVTDILKSSGERGLFAICDAAVPASCADINDNIAQLLGREHCVEGLLSLAQLGFDAWPKTIAGKIGYAALKVTAEKHLALE